MLGWREEGPAGSVEPRCNEPSGAPPPPSGCPIAGRPGKPWVAGSATWWGASAGGAAVEGNPSGKPGCLSNEPPKEAACRPEAVCLAPKRPPGGGGWWWGGTRGLAAEVTTRGRARLPAA